MALRGCMANVVTLLGAKWRREKTRCPLRGVGTALRPFFWAVGGGEAPSPPFLRESAHYLLFAHPPPPSQGKTLPRPSVKAPVGKILTNSPFGTRKKRKKKNVPLKKDEESLPIPHSPIIHYFGWPRWLPLSWEKPASRTAHNSLFLLCAAPLSFFSEASAAQKRHFLH